MRNKNLNFICFGVFAAAFVVGTFAYSVKAQKSISDKVIRFHVVANSDSKEDQDLKKRVRDEILDFMDGKICAAANKEEAEEILAENLGKIEELSKSTIEAQGFDYGVRAYIAEESFPLKTYGNLTFPAGSYRALKITIGEAEGKNWWCVMFPPLCLTEESLCEEGQRVLSETLTESDMELVSRNNEKSVSKVKFFIVEKWQEFINRP